MFDAVKLHRYARNYVTAETAASLRRIDRDARKAAEARAVTRKLREKAGK